MTDKEQAERILPALDLGLSGLGQGRWIARKSVGVEPMVQGNNLAAAPHAQFPGKGRAGSNRNIGAPYRLPGEPTLEQSVGPDGVVAPGVDIAPEIGRSIEGVTGEKYLRYRRTPKGKVAGGNQHLGGAPANQPRQRQLLAQKTPGRTGGFRILEKGDVGQFPKFGAQRGIQEHGRLSVRSPRQMGNHVAQVGKASTGARGPAIDEQSDHRLGHQRLGIIGWERQSQNRQATGAGPGERTRRPRPRPEPHRRAETPETKNTRRDNTPRQRASLRRWRGPDPRAPPWPAELNSDVGWRFASSRQRLSRHSTQSSPAMQRKATRPAGPPTR